MAQYRYVWRVEGQNALGQWVGVYRSCHVAKHDGDGLGPSTAPFDDAGLNYALGVDFNPNLGGFPTMGWRKAAADRWAVDEADVIFGFASRAQLDRWFVPDRLAAMVADGARVRRIRVPRDRVAVGTDQCVFARPQEGRKQ